MREAHPLQWYVGGTYFEACNCLPICLCREVGGREGGRSTGATRLCCIGARSRP